MAAIVVQIFERPGTAVVYRPGERDRGRTEFFTNGRRQRGRGSFLPDLLAPALQRAFALEAVDDIVSVPQHLHLDVPSAFDELLDIEPAIAEGRERLRLRLRHQVMKLLGRARDADAAAAAARRRLDHHGKADLLRHGERRLRRVQPAAAARNRGHARCRRRFPGGDLVAHQADRLRRRPHEDESRPPRPRRRTRRSRPEIHSPDGWRRRRSSWPPPRIASRLRYDFDACAGPISMLSSASRTASESLSALL